MTEINGNPRVEKEPLDLQARVWVSDAGKLIFDLSREDRRYPYMPTIAEVLTGYCIDSDLEVPEEILEILPDGQRTFIENEWHQGRLEERKKQNQHHPLVKGNHLYLGMYVKDALIKRGVDESVIDNYYGIFRGPIDAFNVDEDLQKELKDRLPENMGGLIGKTGFDRYFISYE